MSLRKLREKVKTLIKSNLIDILKRRDLLNKKIIERNETNSIITELTKELMQDETNDDEFNYLKRVVNGVLKKSGILNLEEYKINVEHI